MLSGGIKSMERPSLDPLEIISIAEKSILSINCVHGAYRVQVAELSAVAVISHLRVAGAWYDRPFKNVNYLASTV